MAFLLRKLAPVPVILVLACAGFAQGVLSGKVTDKDGKPAAGVTLVVTNQTSTKQYTKRTQTDGSYAVKLPQGAYSVRVDAPLEARFDRGKLGERRQSIHRRLLIVPTGQHRT